MIISHLDNHAIAEAAAKTLAEMALEKQGKLRVALTGGSLGILLIEKLAGYPDALNNMKLVFGDERFVSHSDPERNEGQGLAVCSPLQTADLLRYPEPADGDLEHCREVFERAFANRFGEEAFDVVILGMGPDGHVASLFPGHDRVGVLVIAEPDSPKPPAQRLSLSYSALNNANSVWFLISGESKSAAARCSWLQTCDLPAAKVRGLKETRWLVDEAVARELSAD